MADMRAWKSSERACSVGGGRKLHQCARSRCRAGRGAAPVLLYAVLLLYVLLYAANLTTKSPAVVTPTTAASYHSPSRLYTAWHRAPMAHAGGACPASAAFCCAARICCATCGSDRTNGGRALAPQRGLPLPEPPCTSRGRATGARALAALAARL